MSTYTPMIQQYLKIKAQHKDSFLFFRLGDFYEMFFEDALKAAKELEITLTSRDGGGEERIPMCGIPYHAASNYIKVLVDRGFKVAICEQVEDPKTSKGVVRREVVQMITPGTVMEGKMLSEKDNNYLAALDQVKQNFVLSLCDLSTGELSVMSVEDGFDRVVSELFNRPIKEVIVAPDFDEELIEQLTSRIELTISEQQNEQLADGFTHLLEPLTDEDLKNGVTRLITYINMTQRRQVDHLKPVQRIELNRFLGLDMYSKRNLELTETIMKKGKAGSLLWVLDETVTAMGARQLKKYLERPLLDVQTLDRRYACVEGFIDDFINRDQLRKELKAVYDIERLAGRVAFGNVNGRDLIQLKFSLEKIPALKETLHAFGSRVLNEKAEHLDALPELYQLLDESLLLDPPMTIKEGGLIKDGYHEALDQYRDASRNGKTWIAELERQEREATKIKSLKVGYNRVFGYYIEVTKANLHLLPEGKYERKQTLTNAERYITPDLKEKEKLILEAEEKSIDLEYDLFIALRDDVKAFIPALQVLADKLSEIDVLQSFATVSEKQGYVKPVLTNDNTLSISKGRHPVVEKVMKDEMYVPNDVALNDKYGMLLITGPNMSGKSTYMRQVALTVIMAQIGCFVPAESAILPVFDQIFTRIGAADDLVAGQSTFMVEMLESNHALKHATDRSLILLDEIGRGTSTYDGMALAQAIIEYVHDHIGAKTLFSTHYHELTTLEQSLAHLKNVHVRAEEYQGRVVFLHQIEDGPADESYGIHVAKLAGLPETLIDRANVILTALEKDDGPTPSPNQKTPVVEADQLSFFAVDQPVKPKTKSSKSTQHTSEIIATIEALDILEMTPIDAMNMLYQLKKQAQEE